MNREFALVTACCLWPPSPQRDAAVVAAVARQVDWPGFLKVARRHRVQGLVWNGLSCAKIAIPPDVAQALKSDADRIAGASLRFCAETIRLQRLFDRAGLRCAFVKGATLASLAYGTFAVRHAKDIDMIVPDEELSAASDVLAAAGYRRIRPLPSSTEAQLALWRTYGKDMEWRHDRSGIELELHWRLSPISAPLNEPIDFSALHPVDMTPSCRVLTLPPERLFFYLCAHGAAHGWCRLKWLADIHALIADRTDEHILLIYRQGRAMGVGRAVGQALLLCADLFGLRLPRDLAAELRGSRIISLLAGIGRLCMTRGHAQTEIYDLPFGTTLIAASHLLLAPSTSALIAALWHKGVNLDDVHRLPLPRSLGFLYRLLRWPLWLCRRVSSAGTSPAK